jgi:type III secretory pathway component EscR
MKTMTARTSLYLLIASILYPLGLLIISQTVISLQMYIIFASFYIYIVGWSTIALEKE